MNECVLVGRVKELPEIKTTSKGNTVASLIMESDRNFRDEDGNIGTDIFNVTVWRGAAEQAAALCKPGSVIAVKGRLLLTSNLIVDEKQRNQKLLFFAI
ncbi:MAG: single-stranded DNA-binding protein [Solobacterium sp.]|nr:single-stranded DNA-binding protein [Solobacterium sp.]